MENFLYFYIYFVFVGTLIVNSNGNVPTEKLCADLSCQRIISHGRTIPSNDQHNEYAGLFKKGDEGDVYARVGNFYEVEIKGKRVLVPVKFFIQDKINIKNEDLVSVSVPNVSGVTEPLKTIQRGNADKDDIQTQLHKSEQESQKLFVEVKKPENNIEVESEKGSSKILEGSSIGEFFPSNKAAALLKVDNVKLHAEEKLVTSVDDKLPEKKQLKSSVGSVESENVTNTVPLPRVTANEIVTSNLENETITEKPNISPVQSPDNSEVIDGTTLPKEEHSDDEVTVEDDNEDDEEEEHNEEEFEEFEYIEVDENDININETIKNKHLTLEANVPGNSAIVTQNPNSSNLTLSEKIQQADNLDTKVDLKNNTKVDDVLVKKAEGANEKADNLGSNSEGETKVDVDNKSNLKENINGKNENKNVHLDENSSKSIGIITNSPEVTTNPPYEPEFLQNPLLDLKNNTKVDDVLVKKAEGANEKADNLGGNSEGETKVDVDNKSNLKENINGKNENKNVHLDENSSKSIGIITNSPEVTTNPPYEPEFLQNPLLDLKNNTKVDDVLVKKAEGANEKADNLGGNSEGETKVDVDNKSNLKENINGKNENKNVHLDENSSKSIGIITNSPEVTTNPPYEPEFLQNPLLETTTQNDMHSHVTLAPNAEREKVEIVEDNLHENQISEEQINKPEYNNSIGDNGQEQPYHSDSYSTEQLENKKQFAIYGDTIAQESMNKKPDVNNDATQKDIGLEPALERSSQKDSSISKEINNPYDKLPPVRKSNEDGSFAYDPYHSVQHQTEDSNDFKSQGESIENIPIENSEPNIEESSRSFIHDKFAVSENSKGLFSTMLETVKKVWYTTTKHEYNSDEKLDTELERILYPNQKPKQETGFCEKLSPESCPSSKRPHMSEFHPHCASEKDFFTSLNDKILETVDLLVFLGVVALTVLIFAFGYYCISHGKKENALLSKLNIVERSLLASNKEGFILKHELMETRNKLTSIENNSFGSNDMVLALKKELEASEEANFKLKDQVAALEAELENAAEAGLELNKIVSDLLNSQGGDDSIISSVEELQKQLNEQQNTIVQINTTLAEKSRENSELQLAIAGQTAKFSEEIQNLKRLNTELEERKDASEAKHIETKQLLEEQMSRALEEKTLEVATLRNEIAVLKTKYEETSRKWQKSEARLQALEECLGEVKKNPKVNIKDLTDLVNIKTEMLATSRERDSLKERLEGEMDARKLLEDHVKIISEEVSVLKQEYTQSEKDKLEAQTRLEVLSSYFKEKETQLQKELSVKEAMWMKQQGETTSTVERVRTMQDELQGLKSQNDSLRAEIEAQAAAHKAQIASLENRSHENWLAARQTERKLEESRSEATALRRKLTSLAGNPVTSDANMQNRAPNVDGLPNDLNNATSPLHMESPSSPLLGGLPPPAFLPPPPFMAPPHPFMPMPPPFIPPGEMRPPPLGRLMSPPPPPPHDRYSPSIIDGRDRYSPENGRYSPDSRYNYNTDIMSTYDTETDFSPPPSPQTRSAGGSGGGYNNRDRERNRIYKPFSPPPTTNADRSKKTKGILSSGSADSYDSRKSKGKGKV